MKILPYLLIGLLALALLGTQLGLLRGQRPADLGVRDGRLKAPSSTPNSVSSQAHLYPGHPQRERAAMAPFPLVRPDAAASLAHLAGVVRATPGMTLVDQRPDYLYAEAQTRWLKFVDDVEFWFNPALGAIEVRSASRLGSGDLGANRERVERIRASYLRTASAGR